jgi:2-phosphoglycerate kinase
MKNKKVILIGGAPCVGKSSLAVALSKKLGMPSISTDMIREFMRALVSPEKYPELFQFSDRIAEEYLSSHTPQEIVQNQNKESQAVWKGVVKFIESVGKTYENCYIIEGVAVLPGLVYANYKKDASVKTFFVVDNNEDRIRKVILERGLWDNADKYPDSVKEKEVQWVMEFNKYIKEEIKKYPFPIIEVKERDDLVEEIIKKLED